MGAYYNEHDPFAAAWLRELIKANLIAPGDVDERDIQQVCADDLGGYTQCHFFAGIGGWSYALRLAGWPDDRSVWTGSCPCQPFSAAGKGASADDPRHLWPAWLRLIRECRPDPIFGEQVASVDGLAWFDLVSTDLEGADYAVGAVDLGAASVGAPHGRQRLWIVGDARQPRLERLTGHGDNRHQSRWISENTDGPVATASTTRGVAYADEERHRAIRDSAAGWGESLGRGMGDTTSERGWREPQHAELESAQGLQSGRSSTRGFWDGAQPLACGDGKTRFIEPGLAPLAHGVSARVGRLRGYGNAIVPQVAAEVIRAYLECYADGGWR